MKLGLLIMTFLFLSCHSEEKLSLISKEETLNRILNGEAQQFKFAPYRNEDGLELSKEESQLLNTGKLTRRYYQSSDKIVKELRCVPMQEEDIFYDIRLTEFLTANPLKKINQVPINCSVIDQDSLFNVLYEIDQGLRRGTIDHDSLSHNDKNNQIVMVSLIEQCGFPTKTQNVLSAWFVMQHSGHSGLMEYYHDQFEKSAKIGNLDKSKLATMQDRILMHHTKPQLYGTQLVGGTVSKKEGINTAGQTFGFHPIYDIKNVNQRRKAVGLIPIEEFAKERGFEFKIEDYD